MKIRVALVLCVVLGAGFISIRAADTPAQAAARSALIQKLNQSDNSPSQPLPATNTLSEAVVEQPAKSAATVTEMVPAKAMTPQTAPVATTPVAPPPVVTPAVVSPAVVAPAAVAPASVSPAVAPTRSFLILSLLFLSMLLIVLLIMLFLLLKLRQLKLLLLKHSAVVVSPVVVPSEIQPAAAAATPKPAPVPAATKRPVQRRKRVRQLNGTGSNVNLPKLSGQLRRHNGAGSVLE